MDAKIKSLLIAIAAGGGAALGTEQLAKTQFMQEHPNAWYAEGAAAVAVGMLLVKKSPKYRDVGFALASAGAVLLVQGYRHQQGGATPPAGGSTPQSAPAALPANGNSGVVPPQLPAGGTSGMDAAQAAQSVKSLADSLIQAANQGAFSGSDFGIPSGPSNLGDLQASADNVGALLRRNYAGAMLRNAAMRLGRQ
jgi:hypothetical protein